MQANLLKQKTIWNVLSDFIVKVAFKYKQLTLYKMG